MFVDSGGQTSRLCVFVSDAKWGFYMSRNCSFLIHSLLQRKVYYT